MQKSRKRGALSAFNQCDGTAPNSPLLNAFNRLASNRTWEHHYRDQFNIYQQTLMTLNDTMDVYGGRSFILVYRALTCQSVPSLNHPQFYRVYPGGGWVIQSSSTTGQNMTCFVDCIAQIILKLEINSQQLATDISALSAPTFKSYCFHYGDVSVGAAFKVKLILSVTLKSVVCRSRAALFARHSPL